MIDYKNQEYNVEELPVIKIVLYRASHLQMVSVYLMDVLPKYDVPGSIFILSVNYCS